MHKQTTNRKNLQRKWKQQKKNKKKLEKKKQQNTEKYKCNLVFVKYEGCFRYQTLQNLSCYEEIVEVHVVHTIFKEHFFNVNY